MSPAGILVVEDDDVMRGFLKTALTDAGFSVRGAVSGPEALSMVRMQKPDVIILDFLMPEMNGEEVCRKIKQDPQFQDIVIFIVSGKTDLETKLQCFESGADEYLTKPVDAKELAPRINRFLKGKGRPVPAPAPLKGAGAKDEISWTDVSMARSAFGPYRVEGLVGKGGMGQVYKAIDTLLQRPVAIKVLSKKLCDSEEFVERFRREARLLASIDHPGIATVYTFGVEQNDHYFAMQWCSGGSLSELIQKKKRIEPVDAVDYVIQCGRALGAAARKGIVHRDIKPSNLMFDEDGRIKLVDFGLAFSENANIHLTAVSETLGTPAYMSPEQSRNENVDLRSDIYSLGISFYHMLYGKTPFSGSSLVDVIIKHATQGFPRFDSCGGRIPEEVYKIIERMCQKDPGARFQNYESLIEALVEIQAPATPARREAEPVTVVEKSADSIAEGKIILSNYVVEKAIGEDYFGRVYKAFDQKQQQYAAVRAFSGQCLADPQWRKQLEESILKLASLNHPGVGTIYDFSKEGERYYLTQEWCPGGSVSNLVRKKGRLSLDSAASLLLQCVSALAAAHGAGIIHGNVRPNNLLLDENQKIKIVDLAWAGARRKARKTNDSGAQFMAPESADATCDIRADIYSLGMIFYYMLYGTVPEHSLPAYDGLGGDIPRQAYDIAIRMTKPLPSERYQDYDSLIQDLQSLQHAAAPQAALLFPATRGLSTACMFKANNFFDALSTAYDKNASGTLVLRWAVLESRFTVRQREIIYFESNEPTKSVWYSLIRAGCIEKSQVPSQSEHTEVALRGFLRSGTFSMSTLKDAYQKVMKEAIDEVFIWPVCEAQFFAANVQGSALGAVRISDVLLEGARSLVDFTVIRSGVRADHLIRRTARFEQLLSSFNLASEESYLAFRVEGEDTSLNGLQALTGLPEEKIFRFMYLLEKIGAIELRPVHSATEKKRVVSHRKEVVQPPTPTPVPQASNPISHTSIPVPHTPTPISHASIPVPQTPTPISRTSIPVSRTPAPAQASDQHAQTPVAQPPPTPETASRPEPTARVGPQKSEKAMEAEKAAKTADQFFKAAMAKYKSGDFWRAADLANQAICHHPDAKYYYLLAISYAEHPRFQKQAEEAFHHAIRMSPLNADYHADLAAFYVEKKLLLRARTHCDKALELNPIQEKAEEVRDFLQTQALKAGGCWCAKSE